MDLFLSSGESLTAVLAGAITTTNPTYIVKWKNASGNNSSVGSLTGATAKTLASCPTSDQVYVEQVSIYNADTAAATVTIAKVSGGTSYTLFKAQLQVNETLIADDGDIKVVDSNGRMKTSSSATVVDLADGSEITLGTDDDLVIEFNATDNVVTSGPSSGLWANCPSLLDPDPSKFYVFFDDFLHPASATASDLHAYTDNNDGGTGTNAFQDAAGGFYNVVTAAADNDYHAMSSVNEIWKFAAGKKLWFEARFRLTEATTNESAWWFGLTDTLTTGGFQANALGPLASYDGVLIWKDEATMTIDFETSNATTQNTTTNMGTFVSGQLTRVGFYFDGTATTSVVTPYIDVNGNGLVAGTAQNITLAGLEEMHLVFGVKAGPTAGAETLEVDYIKVVQLR